MRRTALIGVILVFGFFAALPFRRASVDRSGGESSDATLSATPSAAVRTRSLSDSRWRAAQQIQFDQPGPSDRRAVPPRHGHAVSATAHINHRSPPSSRQTHASDDGSGRAMLTRRSAADRDFAATPLTGHSLPRSIQRYMPPVEPPKAIRDRYDALHQRLPSPPADAGMSGGNGNATLRPRVSHPPNNEVAKSKVAKSEVAKSEVAGSMASTSPRTKVADADSRGRAATTIDRTGESVRTLWSGGGSRFEPMNPSPPRDESESGASRLQPQSGGPSDGSIDRPRFWITQPE